MKTTNLSNLIHFGKASVKIFLGEVGSGKSNAIMQTVAMNPKAIAVFLNAALWMDYIRDSDTIITVEESDNSDSIVALLSVSMKTEGCRIYLNIHDVYENVQSVITAMVKDNPYKEYIFVFNNVPHNSLPSMKLLEELVYNNIRIYIETQCTLDIDRDILHTADRVLFKTLNAYVKILHSDSPIEKERAALACGEALYVSEGTKSARFVLQMYIIAENDDEVE